MDEFTCDKCKYISITEIEQQKMHNAGEEMIPHMCTLYNERLYHFNVTYNTQIIFPCVSCIKHQYVEFSPREEEKEND